MITESLKDGFEATKKNSSSVVPVFAGLHAIVFLITYLLNLPFLNILMIPVVLLMQLAIFKSFKHPLAQLDINEVLGLKDSNLQTKLWNLFVTYAVYIILIILLFLLLVIPGIIFMVYWYVAIYITLDQGITGWAALKKSKEMISGKWWRTFALVVIMGLLSAVISSIVSSVSMGNTLVGGLLMSIISALISLYFGYVGVAYYFKLK